MLIIKELQAETNVRPLLLKFPSFVGLQPIPFKTTSIFSNRIYRQARRTPSAVTAGVTPSGSDYFSGLPGSGNNLSEAGQPQAAFRRHGGRFTDAINFAHYLLPLHPFKQIIKSEKRECLTQGTSP